MNTTLFPIRTLDLQGEVQPGVNARDLYVFLGIKKDYTNWIKTQVERADLQEGQDFVFFAFLGENPKRGRPCMEYRLTADAAKEIAIISQTPKGKQARRYLIEVEKQWRTGIQAEVLPPPNSRPLKNWQLRCANARETVLRYLIRLVDQTGQSLNWAMERLIEDAEAKRLPGEIQAQIPIANARAGCVGSRALSRRSLERWLADAREGLDSLAPLRGLRETPPWLPLLLAILGNPPQHSLLKAHRMLLAILPEQDSKPSYHAARRWLGAAAQRPDRVPNVSVTGRDILDAYGEHAALALHHINPVFPHPDHLTAPLLG